jgi:prepilin-type N-terminal cleavage/methylation domain-containing protein
MNATHATHTKVKAKPVRRNGFTLIEVMFTLLLVSLVVMTTARMTVVAFDSYKKSKAGFLLFSRMEDFKNQLLSGSFDSEKWNAGSYSTVEDPFMINWTIRLATPTLKVAHLSFSHKNGGVVRRDGFYKSRHILHRK